MADEENLFIPGEEVRGELAAQAPTARAALPANQPQPVADSRLAAILQRKEAGEKLSAADRGYLGAVKRKGSPKKMAAAANPNPLLEIPANPDNPLFEAEAKAEAPAGGAPVPPVDTALLHRTADAILSSIDLGTKLYVGYEARQAGGTPETVEQYKSAVALQDENRKLMVENSEPVVLWLCKIFQCAPEQLEAVMKSSGFLGGASMHLLGVITTVKSIRESKKERAANLTGNAPAKK